MSASPIEAPAGGLSIAVFASGKGSNLAAIDSAVDSGVIPKSRISLVLCNNSSAAALDFARAHGIAAVHCCRTQYASDGEFNRALLGHLRAHDVNFIALAGYVKRIDASIIAEFPDRIVNIHPALLPAFGGKGMYGMHVHHAVIDAHATESGATVHIVDGEYDRGPIVLQRRVPVHGNDSAATLAARVLQIEHELYPEALRLFAEGRVIVVDRHVSIK